MSDDPLGDLLRASGYEPPSRAEVQSWRGGILGELGGSRFGETWTCDLPCPQCGTKNVIGVLLVTEEGNHQHTKYICTLYPKGATAQCGWEGWTIPGWDRDPDE